MPVTVRAFRTTSARAFTFQTQNVQAYTYQMQTWYVKTFTFVALPKTSCMSVHMPLPTRCGCTYAYLTKMGTVLALRATSVNA
jgi:hypothetical protein